MSADLHSQQEVIKAERNRWLEPPTEPDPDELTDQERREIAAELAWEAKRGQ